MGASWFEMISISPKLYLVRIVLVEVVASDLNSQLGCRHAERIEVEAKRTKLIKTDDDYEENDDFHPSQQCPAVMTLLEPTMEPPHIKLPPTPRVSMICVTNCENVKEE